MEAIILAGGLGTRLQAVVSDVPKPLAAVAGRPFIIWILDALAEQGFDKAILSVGYRHEQIVDALGHAWQDMALDYAIESVPLGTGGAIRFAIRQASAEQLFVLNGDTYLALDYEVMLNAHLQSHSLLSLAAVTVSDKSRFGGLEIVGDRVTGFLEKGGTGVGRVNGGTYIINRNLFDLLSLPDKFSFESEILSARVTSLKPLAFMVDGLFIDMGVPEDFARAQTLFGK